MIVDVVQCKDCKYYEPTIDAFGDMWVFGRCMYWDYNKEQRPHEMYNDDYCSNGVKRNED